MKPRPAQYSKSMKKNELCKSQVLKIFGKVARSMRSICDTAQEMSRGAPCGQLDQLGLPLFKSHCLKSHMSHMSARICKPQPAIQCNPILCIYHIHAKYYQCYQPQPPQLSVLQHIGRQHTSTQTLVSCQQFLSESE